jgi:ubiquinone/menaquinone biosynthesis C-methylase UbiE
METTLCAKIVLIVGILALLSFPKLATCEPFYAAALGEAYDKRYTTVYDVLTYDNNRIQYDISKINELITPQSVVLDIGCGRGHHVGALPNAVGLDLSKDMIAAARSRYPTKHFVEGDAHDRWVFMNATVTHVLVLYYTIYCFPNKHKVFQNIIYWLQPGGTCLLHVADQLEYGTTSVKRSNLQYTQRQHDTELYESFVIGNTKQKYKHRIYFESYQTILDLVKQVGFIITAEYAYPKSPAQHLIVLQKPF